MCVVLYPEIPVHYSSSDHDAVIFERVERCGLAILESNVVYM